jgi:hypothetical protein
MTLRRGTKVVIGAVVAFAVIVGVTAALVTDSSTDCESFRVDSHAWSASGATKPKDGGDSARQRIADDIRTCNALVGKNRATVHRLLGRRQYGPKTAWKYRLGPDRRSGGALPFDTEILTVAFDTEGTVSSVSMSVP